MELRIVEIAKQEYGVRSTLDRRVIVDREICTYKDEQGNEYRKAFEFKRGTAPMQKRRAEKDVCYLSDAECEEFLQAENFISNRFINNSV